jgi:1-aminocyclopropane-1-carboxylate deaminase/D-cysteine desulfhydrase-like pyridoxal-dependent ACC family enzyme
LFNAVERSRLSPKANEGKRDSFHAHGRFRRQAHFNFCPQVGTGLTDAISVCLAAHPHAGLIQIPAIIHRLPRLSARFGYEIYVLRDDLTGFGLGGNKTRKVDFLLGDALARQATALVTMKATSFSRNAAAGAAACGLALHVLLPGTESDQNPLSQAVFRRWGARLHFEANGPEALADRQDSLVSSLRSQGENVYALHPGGSDAIGALSYVSVLDEICAFSDRTGVHFPHIVHSTSSAGTQAGLVVGQCIAGYDTRVVGVSASRSAADQSELVRELARSTAQLLGHPVDLGKVVADDGFVGPGYAKASAEGEYAAQIFAELEGILLDSVYTGKAAAALMHYLENRVFDDGPVLFIHTGGNADVYN